MQGEGDNLGSYDDKSAYENDVAYKKKSLLWNIRVVSTDLYKSVHSSPGTRAEIVLLNATVHGTVVGERGELGVERCN